MIASFLSRSTVGVIGVATVALVAMFATHSARADVFTIDSSQTSLSITGSFAGYVLQPQGAGSLVTKYSGTVQLSQTAGTIQFTGGSLVTAKTNGSWAPTSGGATTGTAPADYGGVAFPFSTTAYAAFRGLQFDVTSPSLALSGGQFNPAAMTFQFTTTSSNVVDYNSFLQSGQLTLSGNATNNVGTNATVVTSGSTQTLTVGVNTTFKFSLLSSNDSSVTVMGQLVATNGGSSSTPLVIQKPIVNGKVLTLNWQAAASQSFQIISTTNFHSFVTNATVTSPTTNYTWSVTNQGNSGYYRLAH